MCAVVAQWLGGALQNTGVLKLREGETLAVSFVELLYWWLVFSSVLEFFIKTVCDSDGADTPPPPPTMAARCEDGLEELPSHTPQNPELVLIGCLG